MKKIFISTLAIFSFTILLSTQNYKHAIIGAWKTELRNNVTSYMVFTKNNHLEIIIKYSNNEKKSISRTYDIVGNKIYVKANYSVNSYTFTIHKLNNKIMILTNQAGRKFLYKRMRRARRGKRHNIPKKERLQ
jgi:uncharacterized protein (TIGR03066 family)